MDFKVLSVNASLAYFKEKLTNGYNQAGYAVPYQYREYNYSSSLTHPEYVNGEVVENGTPVGYRTLQTFGVFQRPDNGITTDKWGIEYSLDFGKIDVIKHQFSWTEHFFHTKNIRQ